MAPDLHTGSDKKVPAPEHCFRLVMHLAWKTIEASDNSVDISSGSVKVAGRLYLHGHQPCFRGRGGVRGEGNLWKSEEEGYADFH